MSLCECGAPLADDAAICSACGRTRVVQVAEAGVAVKLAESTAAWTDLSDLEPDDSLAFRPDDVGIPRRPHYQLVSPLAVAVGGLLGGPLGGCALLAYNFFKLKQRGWALTVLFLGIAAMVASIIAIVSLLVAVPGWTAVRDLGLVFLAQMVSGAVIAVLLTPLLQRRALRYHRQEGGTFLGPRAIIGQSLVCGVLVFVLQAIFSYPFFVRDHVFYFNDNQRMIVGRNIPKDKAHRFAERLQQHGLFKFDVGRAQDVRVIKNDAGYEIHFFLDPGALRNRLVVATFREIRDDCANDPFNDAPLVMILFSPRGAVTIDANGPRGP